MSCHSLVSPRIHHTRLQLSQRMSNNNGAKGGGFQAAIPSNSATMSFPTPSGLEKKLVSPHTPRANIAADAEHPDGTTARDWASTHKNMTVLEQHVVFFNPKRDGVIWPLDTMKGHLKLGFNFFFAFLAMMVIHSGLSWWTQDGWMPDPFFRIYSKNIHRAKHGSDTGVYDSEGRFVPSAFESLFCKFDKDKKGGLSFREGLRMLRQNRNVADPFGWAAAVFEWGTVWLLLAPSDHVITKEQLRTIYDGSLFYEIEYEHSNKNKKLSKDQNNVKYD
ncbi:caleosin [Leucosporidium creatinivorum]|uniref:Caleosin n=1 Tax=Leucosporidium creatinivorum TaxID=106004 RepID=A0A1Y2EY38_9BASI|nr:caleosin [Leucosporidium creatinivorum]